LLLLYLILYKTHKIFKPCCMPVISFRMWSRKAHLLNALSNLIFTACKRLSPFFLQLHDSLPHTRHIQP
jgi:hypothetical protein